MNAKKRANLTLVMIWMAMVKSAAVTLFSLNYSIRIKTVNSMLRKSQMLYKQSKMVSKTSSFGTQKVLQRINNLDSFRRKESLLRQRTLPMFRIPILSTLLLKRRLKLEQRINWPRRDDKIIRMILIIS